MVTAGNGSSEPCWTLRDWLAAALLFTASAAVVLWQNAHVAVLWDLSYVLDSASRIALGQMPYRDFPFVHPPLTFLIQAAILRFTGRVYFHHVVYVAAVAGFSTTLTWRILLYSLHARMKNAWPTSLLLAAPLAVLGIYCVFPFPSYDCDCTCSILIAIYLLQRLSARASFLQAAATGAALCIPLFFKQNIGLPFLAVSLGIILLLCCVEFLAGLPRNRQLPSEQGNRAPSFRPPRRISGERVGQPHAFQLRILFAVLIAAAATLSAALLLIHFSAGLGNYLHWTIQFAAQRRLPGLTDMLGVYRDPSLLWKLPSVAAGLLLLRARFARTKWTQFLAIALLSAPFLFTLCSLFLYDDADERGDTLLALWPLLLILAAVLAIYRLVRLRSSLTLASLLPIIVLVAINGTLMSQQLWGSTYAIWPLLIILVADQVAFLATPNAIGFPRPAAPAMAFIVSLTLLVCGAFYIASEERLSYAQLPDDTPQHSAFPQLKGMSLAGPFLPDFDELLRYAAANIPINDGLIILPGEDPFYFATGRVPQFPILLFDPATDPYSPSQLADESRKNQIRWLIVKRHLQINADATPDREATLRALLPSFTLAAHLHAYDIYRR